VFVGDDSLNRAIAGVRRIAAGIGDGSFEIETIPRTGYRLVCDTEPVLVGEPDLGTQAKRGSTKRISRRGLVAGSAVVAVGALALWNLGRTSPDPTKQLISDSQIQMRSGTPEGGANAIRLLRQAVTRSPTDSEAWGQLALTIARVDEHALDRAAYAVTEVETAANRALQLDGQNADAKAALAISVPYYGDWLAAERRFDAVLADHPDHIFTRDSRQFMFGAVGRMKEAGQARMAFPDSAKFDATLAYKGVYALWFLDRISEADRLADQLLEMRPREPGTWFAKLWVLAGSGRFDRAIAHIEDKAGRPEFPPPMFETLQLAMEAAHSRQPAAIAAATRRLMRGVEQNVAAVINAMMLFNLMGAIDQAFELADAYYLERGPVIAAVRWRPGQPLVPDQRRRKTNILFVPSAAAMQRDPRFMPMMEDMGLVDYWAKRGIGPDFLDGKSD
jgi:tetratricopeptide (TPR) repeat protein